MATIEYYDGTIWQDDRTVEEMAMDTTMAMEYRGEFPSMLEVDGQIQIFQDCQRYAIVF